MNSTPGRAFYDRQVALLEAGDVESLIEQQYQPDAVLVNFDVEVRGHEALRKHFHGYMEHLGYIKLLTTDKFAETDDSIFFEATVRTALGEARVYDILLLRGGKATHHFTGVISLTPAEELEEAS